MWQHVLLGVGIKLRKDASGHRVERQFVLRSKNRGYRSENYTACDFHSANLTRASDRNLHQVIRLMVGGCPGRAAPRWIVLLPPPLLVIDVTATAAEDGFHRAWLAGGKAWRPIRPLQCRIGRTLPSSCTPAPTPGRRHRYDGIASRPVQRKFSRRVAGASIPYREHRALLQEPAVDVRAVPGAQQAPLVLATAGACVGIAIRDNTLAWRAKQAVATVGPRRPAWWIDDLPPCSTGR